MPSITFMHRSNALGVEPEASAFAQRTLNARLRIIMCACWCLWEVAGTHSAAAKAASDGTRRRWLEMAVVLSGQAVMAPHC